MRIRSSGECVRADSVRVLADAPAQQPDSKIEHLIIGTPMASRERMSKRTTTSSRSPKSRSPESTSGPSPVVVHVPSPSPVVVHASRDGLATGGDVNVMYDETPRRPWVDKLDHRTGEIAESRVHLGDAEIVVHRHRDHDPDQWLYSCHRCGLERIEVAHRGASLHDAKEATVDHLERKLRRLVFALEKIAW